VTSICTQLYLSFMPSSYLLPLTSIYTPLKSSSLDFPGWYLYQPTGIELEPSFLPLFFSQTLLAFFFFLFWPFAYQFNGQLASAGPGPKTRRLKRKISHKCHKQNSRAMSEDTVHHRHRSMYIFMPYIFLGCELTIKPPNLQILKVVSVARMQ